MALVSVTRLRLRGRPWLVPFGWNALWIARQLVRSPGFLDGLTAYERGLGMWTLTVWRDADAMKAFRTSGAHLKSLRGVMDWCCEASYGHWEQPSDALPELAEAHRRLREVGKLSKVARPTPEHAAGQLCSNVVPKQSQRLRPRA